jgi:hypothetical protein
MQQGPAGDQGGEFGLDDVMQGAGFSTAAGGDSVTAGVNPLSRKKLAGSMATQQQQQPPSVGFVSAASITKAAAGSNAVKGGAAAAAAGELDASTGGWRVKQHASRAPAAASTQPGFSRGSRSTAGSSIAGSGHGNGGRKDPAAALAQELKAVDDSDDDFM